jgi:hypothetical protein
MAGTHPETALNAAQLECIMDCAELWISPNYCIQMPTVISSVPTAEGFVIGSDGRSRGPDSEVISDEVQKIFPINKPGIRLAYGIFGTAKFGTETNNILFDFETEIPLAIERMGKLRNWWEFLSSLAKSLTESLDTQRAEYGNELDPERGTTITMGGFYGRFQKLGHITFNYKEQHTEGEPHNYPPAFSFPWGSIKLFDLLNEGDQRLAKFAQPSRVGLNTLRDGIERVRKDILMHYDPEARKLDEAVCLGIGGLVQIATVTFADGFRWVSGFEPPK